MKERRLWTAQEHRLIRLKRRNIKASALCRVMRIGAHKNSFFGLLVANEAANSLDG